MQTTITERRGVFALLLMLAVGALALVATSTGTSAAGVELESATAEHAMPDAAAISATPDHCGGAGDLALIEATSAGVASLQPLPAYPGGPCLAVYECSEKCIVINYPGPITICYRHCVVVDLWCP